MDGNRIQCRSCGAEIGMGPVIAGNSLNELLVDYGWLPTSKGYYCPHHAPQVRARLLHRF